MKRDPVTLGALGLLSVFAFASARAHAQQPDPLTTRLKTFTETPIATFQGAECVSISAPKAIVWRLLVGPETAATWLLTGVSGVIPRRASYAKGLTASKGDVLTIDATTAEGPRRIELTVIALQPGEALAYLLKADDADLLDAKVERLTLSFFVDARADGTTDLTLAAHYDADSPFSALLSPTYAKGRRARRLSALNMFKAIAEEAASLPNPPLHDVPSSPQPTSAPKTSPPKTSAPKKK